MPIMEKVSYANLPTTKKDLRKCIDKNVKAASHLRPNDWESEEVAYQACRANESRVPTFKKFFESFAGQALPIAGAMGGMYSMMNQPFGKGSGWNIAAGVGAPALGVGIGQVIQQREAQKMNKAHTARSKGFDVDVVDGDPKWGAGEEQKFDTMMQLSQQQSREQAVGARQQARSQGVMLGPQQQRPVGRYA